jgi:hypothetical protein
VVYEGRGISICLLVIKHFNPFFQAIFQSCHGSLVRPYFHHTSIPFTFPKQSTIYHPATMPSSTSQSPAINAQTLLLLATVFCATTTNALPTSNPSNNALAARGPGLSDQPVQMNPERRTAVADALQGPPAETPQPAAGSIVRGGAIPGNNPNPEPAPYAEEVNTDLADALGAAGGQKKRSLPGGGALGVEGSSGKGGCTVM